MKNVWFIRHGESEGNAGLPTQNAASPPLTPIGRAQAAAVAETITQPPDLIIHSSFIRTRQTAEPTIAKFPHTPIQVWPVEEYTFLSAIHHTNTTRNERFFSSAKYWLASDPEYIDGDPAESFNQLIERAVQTIKDLKKLESKFILIFTHGWFIRAILWQQLTNPAYPADFRTALLHKFQREKLIPRWLVRRFNRTQDIWNEPHRIMFHYLLFATTFHTPNTTVLKFIQAPGRELAFDTITSSHLPSSKNRLSSSL